MVLPCICVAREIFKNRTANSAEGEARGGNDDARVGWAAGVGGEWGFAPNWSFKAEYLHLGFDRQTDNVLFTGTLAAGFPGAAATISRRTDLDIVRAGNQLPLRWPGRRQVLIEVSLQQNLKTPATPGAFFVAPASSSPRAKRA